jgi:hypothetical protein
LEGIKKERNKSLTREKGMRDDRIDHEKEIKTKKFN